MRVSQNGSRSFRVLWHGYSVFESTWEPETNLTHCPAILAGFCRCCKVLLRAMAPTKGGVMLGFALEYNLFWLFNTS